MYEVSEAKAKVVRADGNDAEGLEEFALSIENGIVSQNINVSDISNGAYVLKVTASDKNGFSSTETSVP